MRGPEEKLLAVVGRAVSNGAQLVTADAQVGQFTVGQSFKLIERAAIGAVLCKPLRNAGQENADAVVDGGRTGATSLNILIAFVLFLAG